MQCASLNQTAHDVQKKLDDSIQGVQGRVERCSLEYPESTHELTAKLNQLPRHVTSKEAFDDEVRVLLMNFDMKRPSVLPTPRTTMDLQSIKTECSAETAKQVTTHVQRELLPLEHKVKQLQTDWGLFPSPGHSAVLPRVLDCEKKLEYCEGKQRESELTMVDVVEDMVVVSGHLRELDDKFVMHCASCSPVNGSGVQRTSLCSAPLHDELHGKATGTSCDMHIHMKMAAPNVRWEDASLHTHDKVGGLQATESRAPEVDLRAIANETDNIKKLVHASPQLATGTIEGVGRLELLPGRDAPFGGPRVQRLTGLAHVGATQLTHSLQPMPSSNAKSPHVQSSGQAMNDKRDKIQQAHDIFSFLDSYDESMGDDAVRGRVGATIRGLFSGSGDKKEFKFLDQGSRKSMHRFMKRPTWKGDYAIFMCMCMSQLVPVAFPCSSSCNGAEHNDVLCTPLPFTGEQEAQCMTNLSSSSGR